MGMCKGCSEVFNANDMKDGLCKACIEKGVVIEAKKKDNSRPYNGIGQILTVCGIIWGVWAFNADTTVTSPSQTFGDGENSIYVPSVTVNNIGLMQQQQNHLIGAGILTVIGVILLTVRRKEEE